MTTPLNGVADWISPQSGIASAFGELLQRWRKGALSTDDAQQLQLWLASWETAVTAIPSALVAANLQADLAELAQRLYDFAQLVRTKLLPHSSRALTPKRLAALDANELEALQVPVGELLLGCVAPLLSCLVPERAGGS